jgi:prolyl-tRNA editing enzyme YbaK/EbsC (Cys-tRNA(Pro) deacylase)
MEHPIHQQITDMLRAHGCWFEEFQHQSVRTSEQATKLRTGYTLRQGAKALIMRAKIANEGKKFAMIVIPADQKFDSAKVKQVLGAKDIRFATEDEVETVTNGVKPGGVPPFGNLFDLEVVSDKTLYDSERIVFNAGRTSSIAMKSADYKELVAPKIADIL